MIKNVRTKCIIFPEALRIRVKTFTHNLPEKYSTSTKIAITACKFSKFFRGSTPPAPLGSFLFLHHFKLVLKNQKRKYDGKKSGNYAPPPPLKFFATPLPALVVGEENLVIGFGLPHFRTASAIAVLAYSITCLKQHVQNTNKVSHL